MDVALDANVLVGLLDAADSLHGSATALVRRLIDEGHDVVYLDVCVSEALSVIARRAAQRRASPPSLGVCIDAVGRWLDAGAIAFVAAEAEPRYAAMLDVVAASGGALNVNDALLVTLQREAIIGPVATFDAALARVDGFATFG